MIRSLRSWHRRWLALLGVLLPILLFLALRERPSTPTVESLPADSAPGPATSEGDGP